MPDTYQDLDSFSDRCSCGAIVTFTWDGQYVDQNGRETCSTPWPGGEPRLHEPSPA